MEKKPSPKFLSLDKKLLAVVLAVNILFTIGWTFFSLSTEERAGREKQKRELARIESEILPVVANSVWEIDRPLTRVQMQGMLAVPSVTRVRVFESAHPNTPIFEDKKNGEFQNVEEKRYDLFAPRAAGGQKFGSVIVTVSDDFILSGLKAEALRIFVSETLETLILSLLILYAVRILVLRRLSQLSKYLRRNSLITQNTPEFKTGGSVKYRDEFNLLVDSLNRMIEESKNHQLQIEELKNHAEKANEAKSMFLASVNHELRTPLNAILGVADLLPSSLGNSQEVDQLIQIQKRSGEHLLHLVDEILDFSKIEAGEVKFEMAPLDLRNAFETIRSIMEKSVKEKKNRLEFLVDPDFPALILGDVNRINQIVINLVSNANKFTEQGEVRVKAEGQGSQFVISVKDTGVGIPKDKMAEIFLPFRQLEGSSQRLRTGTGIGLSISKRLAELMGGRIEVESALGQGSEFKVYLPLKVVRLQDAKPVESPSESPGNQKKIKLLVIEDTPEVQLLIRAFLKGTDVQMSFAENGEVGLKNFLKEHYNIVLMDLQMPVMDGFETTQKIREIEEKEGSHEHVPILALTALTTKKDLDQALKSGCDGYVTKPFSKSQLLQTLHKYAAS